MTALPDWMDLPDGMSAEDYNALPEEICRRIEIVDGAIIVNAAPRRLHQDISRRLANALEAASRASLCRVHGCGLAPTRRPTAQPPP